MNNFASLQLCEQCAAKELNDEKRCTACKEKWTGDHLSEEFAPLSVEAQLMKEMRDAAVAQEKLAKQARTRGVIGLVLAACAVALLFYYAGSFLATFQALSAQFTDLATEVSALVEQADAIAVKIDAVDIKGLAEASKQAMEQTSKSMEGLSQRVTALNIEALNESIQDLAVIVSPLARLLGR